MVWVDSDYKTKLHLGDILKQFHKCVLWTREEVSEQRWLWYRTGSHRAVGSIHLHSVLCICKCLLVQTETVTWGSFSWVKYPSHTNWNSSISSHWKQICKKCSLGKSCLVSGIAERDGLPSGQTWIHILKLQLTKLCGLVHITKVIARCPSCVLPAQP